MDTLWQDLRYGIRTLIKNPGFTVVSVITLALGLGANTAIFSLTDQILLRRLPVEKPEELVILRSPGPKSGRVWSDGDGAASLSYPLYKELVEKNNVFSGCWPVLQFLLAFQARVRPNGQTASWYQETTLRCSAFVRPLDEYSRQKTIESLVKDR
jgi:hypothetical protein